jgi:hypothetical protein
MMTTELPFRPSDCDNHYYEALDAFTRHLEPVRAEYRDRDARLPVMDSQGMEGCILFLATRRPA